jgi:hypothetical protein
MERLTRGELEVLRGLSARTFRGAMPSSVRALEARDLVVRDPLGCKGWSLTERGRDAVRHHWDEIVRSSERTHSLALAPVEVSGHIRLKPVQRRQVVHRPEVVVPAVAPRVTRRPRTSVVEEVPVEAPKVGVRPPTTGWLERVSRAQG